MYEARTRALRADPAEAMLTALAAAPAAVAKIRRSPRRHRFLVGLREVVRMAGRVTLGPAWEAGELVVKKLR